MLNHGGQKQQLRAARSFVFSVQ